MTAIVGLESRGYYFGIPLAWALKLPFVPFRKAGKLPGEVVNVEYGLEYGTFIVIIIILILTLIPIPNHNW